MELAARAHSASEGGDSDDTDNKREEEKWSSRHEAYFNSVVDECTVHARLNNSAGYYYYNRFLFFGLLSAIVPAVCSIIVGQFGFQGCAEAGGRNHDWVSVTCLIIVSILSGVSSFFNFGQKAEKHFTAEILFEMIRAELAVELSKKRRFRLAADVLLVKVTLALEKVRSGEQVIPGNVLRLHKLDRQKLAAFRAELAANGSVTVHAGRATPVARARDLFEMP